MTTRSPRLHLVCRSPVPPALQAQHVPREAGQDVPAVAAESPGTEPWNGTDSSRTAVPAPARAPTQPERIVMAAHGIQFDGRGFRFAGYRYHWLADAVRQSRMAGQGCG
jgi:hypothetical protein